MMWSLGHLIGMFGKGNVKEIIQKLSEMEARDRLKKEGKKKQTDAIGDSKVIRKERVEGVN